jgi:hypothetical protein
MRKLKKRVEKLQNDLEGLSEKEQRKVCDCEVLELLKSHKNTTVRSYLTTYRKDILGLSEYVLRGLRLPPNEQQKVKRAYRTKLSKQQKANEPVKHIDQIIKAAVLLTKSKNWKELAVGLTLLSGRRITEILKTATFEDVGEKKAVLFGGQLKAKGERGTYIIPLLGITPKQAVKALKKLRKMLDTTDMTMVQVSEKCSYHCRTIAKDNFSKYVGTDGTFKCTNHDLRAIYATYCTENLKNKSQSPNSFLSMLLGHSEEDLTVANSYQKFYLV